MVRDRQGRGRVRVQLGMRGWRGMGTGWRERRRRIEEIFREVTDGGGGGGERGVRVGV